MGLKKHYDPYMYTGTSGYEGSGEYYCPDYDNYSCGARVGEDITITNNWKYVTCKRCLKQKEKIDKNVEENEKEICNQMGAMAESFKNDKAVKG